VEIQHANKNATHRRKIRSRKMEDHASKTLGEQTKKQCGTPRALQVGYRKHKEQPLSETSHTHRHFFGSVPLPSHERTKAFTDKNATTR
jgi:hypothetical protein